MIAGVSLALVCGVLGNFWLGLVLSRLALNLFQVSHIIWTHMDLVYHFRFNCDACFPKYMRLLQWTLLEFKATSFWSR